jgi:hypothetical protein
MPPDPVALLRSRSYLALLVLAAIIGVPVAAVAYFFLAQVSTHCQPLSGFDGPHCPCAALAWSGVIVALATCGPPLLPFYAAGLHASSPNPGDYRAGRDHL